MPAALTVGGAAVTLEEQGELGAAGLRGAPSCVADLPNLIWVMPAEEL